MEEEVKKATPVKKKRTRKATAKKAKAVEPVKRQYPIEEEDWNVLQKYSTQLTKVRTTSVVKDLSAGNIKELWSVYKKYHPHDKGELGLGCNSCTFKSLLRISKWKFQMEVGQ